MARTSQGRKVAAGLCLHCISIVVCATSGDDLALLQTSMLENEPELPALKMATHKTPEEDQLRPLHYEMRPSETSRIDVHQKMYLGVRHLMESRPELSHSSHIVEYVRELAHAPSFVNHSGGCLYLPTHEAWDGFYSYMDHPYPPLFAHMLANAFFPKCGHVSLTGATVERCEGGGGIKGTVQTDATCLRTKSIGVSVHGIEVIEVDGVVGMPKQWASHVAGVDKAGTRQRRSSAPKDKCRGHELPAVDPKKRLKVPMEFVICAASEASMRRVTDKMLHDQAEWMNQAYAGKSPINRVDGDDDQLAEVDMQMEFNLTDIRRVTDADCSQFSFVNMKYAGKYNKAHNNAFTVVFVTDDSSGVLGMSNFPFNTPENSDELLTVINVVGLRAFGQKNPDWVYDLTYDEGDTLPHEGGHGLGLYHTFQGGCQGAGDAVSDTNPEAYAHYTCQGSHSCSTTQMDPIHNFMDYTPDKCMSGFTEMQKRRVWCIVENYRPNLFKLSLH